MRQSQYSCSHVHTIRQACQDFDFFPLHFVWLTFFFSSNPFQPPASDRAFENSQMTLNNVRGCVTVFFFSSFFYFLRLLFQTSNLHFNVAALSVLSQLSIGNVGIAKTYVLRFQSVVCSAFFFSIIQIRFAWQL